MNKEKPSNEAQSQPSLLGAVIASFLSEKAKQYGIEEDKLLIDINYGEIRLMRYEEGADVKWRELEIIKTRFF